MPHLILRRSFYIPCNDTLKWISFSGLHDFRHFWWRKWYSCLAVKWENFLTVSMKLDLFSLSWKIAWRISFLCLIRFSLLWLWFNLKCTFCRYFIKEAFCWIVFVWIKIARNVFWSFKDLFGLYVAIKFPRDLLQANTFFGAKITATDSLEGPLEDALQFQGLFEWKFQLYSICKPSSRLCTWITCLRKIFSWFIARRRVWIFTPSL